jgi:hypothetical protein
MDDLNSILREIADQLKRIADGIEATTAHRDGAVGFGDLYDEVASLRELFEGALRKYGDGSTTHAGLPKRYLDVNVD